MSKKLLQAASLVCVGCFMVTSVLAQSMHWRPGSTFFVKPKVGISSYLGDNEKSPFNFDGDAFQTSFPWMLGLEGGYQFSPQNSISVAVQVADYPVITQFPPPPLREGDALAGDSSLRTSVQAYYRRTFGRAQSRVAPYVNLGIGYSFGTVTQNSPPDFSAEESGAAFGPVVGIGLDIAMNARSSFFVEWNSGFHFGDDQLDGNADNGLGGIDILSGFGVGFKINFKKAETPVSVTSLTCSVTGEYEDPVTFSAVTNEAATAPVDVSWDFGDGNTGTGMEASHNYESSGTYTVTVTASNVASTHTSDCEVTVVDSAEIVTITSDKTTVSVCASDPSVTFSANVRGDATLQYSWDFGDGNSSTDASPSHTYADQGTYTAMLTLTNGSGSDTRSMTVTVTDEGCFNCDISQMNSVFFDRNSSVLTQEGRAELQENLEILQNCDFNARVEGHSSRDERNSQQLSEDRARAVMQFYVDNDIDASRITSAGMGASGQTTKKSGASQFRRADTIPEM